MKKIKRVAVTGGSGQIAYSLLFRIANGDLLGFDQPLELAIHDLEEPCTTILPGIVMELEDSHFPLLKNVIISSDPKKIFKGASYALLIGSKPRGPGMERRDLILDNGSIFKEQGRALNEVAGEDILIFVVGNPCNTNCLIAMHNAKDIPKERFHAMTRLDQNRATFQLAKRAKVSINDIKNVTIWGNHSSSLVPDFINATINGFPVFDLISDQKWLENDFFVSTQQRGATIIQARGRSSAASAAAAIIDAIKDLIVPTKKGRWFSSAICSDNNPYKITEDLIFSFPCICKERGVYQIVEDLTLDNFLKEKIKLSERELIAEKEMVLQLL